MSGRARSLCADVSTAMLQEVSDANVACVVAGDSLLEAT